MYSLEHIAEYTLINSIVAEDIKWLGDTYTYHAAAKQSNKTNFNMITCL